MQSEWGPDETFPIDIKYILCFWGVSDGKGICIQGLLVSKTFVDMSPRRSSSDPRIQGSDERASLLDKDRVQARNLVFGSSGDSDMLMWLKGLALNPCNSKAPHEVQKLQNHSLKVRKVLFMGSVGSSQVCCKLKMLFLF